jgi:hypothetical protein
VSEEVAPYSESLIQVQIGNRRYSAVRVPNCLTCQHPARMLIEEMIAQQYPFRKIAERFSMKTVELEEGVPTLLPRITHQNIGNHYRQGHMPVETATLRRLAERRAQQIGLALEESSDRFVDQVVLAEATMARTYERMMLGQIEPEIKDGLAAAKFLQDVQDKAQGGFDSEAWSAAMTVYFETAQRFMAPDIWERFTESLRVDPILRAIVQKMNTSQDEPIDVEYEVNGS